MFRSSLFCLPSSLPSSLPSAGSATVARDWCPPVPTAKSGGWLLFFSACVHISHASLLSLPSLLSLQQEKRKRPEEMVQKERVEGRGIMRGGRFSRSRSRDRGYSGYAVRRSRSPPRRRSRSYSRYVHRYARAPVFWLAVFVRSFVRSLGVAYFLGVAYPSVLRRCGAAVGAFCCCCEASWTSLSRPPSE